MIVESHLISAAILEKDSNGDALWTWTYPAISPAFREVVLRKSGLAWEDSDHQHLPLVYAQFDRQWFYIITTKADSEKLPKVTQVALVLISRDFNPEKYHKFGDVLTATYLKTGNASTLLQQYLSVFTRGSCTEADTTTFDLKSFDNRKAYLNASLKEIISVFGIESILIYTAVLLKKRIAVYSPKVDVLLNVTRALPLLVWHRQNWGIVHPLVHLQPEELEGLGSHFVAGFQDASVEDRTSLYDIFMNVGAAEITIAPHAKECFQMGKVHKDMAMMLVESSKDENMDEQTLIKNISSKTQDIISNLKTLAVEGDDGKPRITLETLQQRKLTPATENFLFNLAAAEGLV